MLILMLSFCGNVSITVVIGCPKWFMVIPLWIAYMSVQGLYKFPWFSLCIAQLCFSIPKKDVLVSTGMEIFCGTVACPRFYWSTFIGACFLKEDWVSGTKVQSPTCFIILALAVWGPGASLLLSLPCEALPLDIDSRHSWFLKQSTTLVCAVFADNFIKKWPKIHNENRLQTYWRDDTSLHQH